MCACYLIYYYDMEPWDAIMIMRRQRPGSVERKVQEETVVRFFTLLSDYGKESIDRLEQRDKQLMEMQRKAQAELIRCFSPCFCWIVLPENKFSGMRLWQRRRPR